MQITLKDGIDASRCGDGLGEQAGHRVHLVMCRGRRRYSEQINEVPELSKHAGPVGEYGNAASKASGMSAEVRERLSAKVGG